MKTNNKLKESKYNKTQNSAQYSKHSTKVHFIHDKNTETAQMAMDVQANRYTYYTRTVETEDENTVLCSKHVSRKISIMELNKNTIK